MTSKKRTHRWRELEALVERDSFGPEPERAVELWIRDGDGYSRCLWEERYVHALQKAIEGGEHLPLLQMFAQGVPLHPALLPALATALRSAIQGTAGGNSRKLTDRQERIVAGLVDSYSAGPKFNEKGEAIGPRLGRDEARAHVAKEWGVSVATVHRAERSQKGKGR